MTSTILRVLNLSMIWRGVKARGAGAGDGPLPFRPLRIVQLAEVQRTPLEHAPAGAHAFDQRPVVVDLAILDSLVGFQEHAGIVARPRGDARG
jgi:hypothetical protein